MAITIHQQPDEHSAISTPLIITASSTNSSNDGFKYVVRIKEPIFNQEAEYIVSPNPNDYLVFQLNGAIKNNLRAQPWLPGTGNSGTNVHNANLGGGGTAFGEVVTFPNINFSSCVKFDIFILEAWDVAGVFTISEASEVEYNLFAYNFLDFTIRNGYKPSLLAQIGHEDGDQSRLMSDRLPSTYYWQYAETVGLSLPNDIFVPVRETDWGVWTIRPQQALDTSISEAVKIKISILPNSGPPVQVTGDLGYFDELLQLTIWPANLNENSVDGYPKPQDYPNWKAIYFQILNADDEQVSMTYVMFNVDRPQTGICNCHDYTPIRLAWVGRRGGWEYYNFNMLSEQEYATEQKVSKRIVGNYGDVGESTDFTFNTFDESERVVYKKIDKFITCSTEKLQQGEWEFLKGLILSKQVHWVHDDGTHTPVIVQDSNIRVRNINAKTLEPLTIRIKVAQEQPN
jgi:hypothetical protein